MDDRIFLMHCRSYHDILHQLTSAMESFHDILPSDRKARILIKPNLNSNMNALTGNTTDLRLLSAVISYLKISGYSDITIGEGTNSGFYRNNIGIISRLGVDRLARYYGIRTSDLNYSKPKEIVFKNNVHANVAQLCFEVDFFINMPKLKTHFEVGMSVCLKNLMGCLIGQENKKKTHDDLPENILLLNQAVRPHLHIVDALIAMEGLGPTRGTPLCLDTVIIGRNPYLVDLLCCQMAGFKFQNIRTLALAEKKGLLTQHQHEKTRQIIESITVHPFKKPDPGPLAAFIHHPNRQKFFLKIRNTPFFTCLASTDWFGNLLFLTGLRQDVFIKDEMDIKHLLLDQDKCNHCGVCRQICPIGLYFPDHVETQESCLKCLYCLSVCPNSAISYNGSPGFFTEQERQYHDHIHAMFHQQ